MAPTLRILLLLLLFLNVSAHAYAHTIITRMSDRKQLSLSQLATEVGSSRVVLLGETHDDPYHHELQLELIRSLSGKRTPLAIGLEMMQSDSQVQLDQWNSGSLSEPAMRELFERNWSDWHLYRDIFVFARDNKIPLVALNVPMHIVKKVSQQGFASLTPEERGNLPAGTSCDLSNPETAFLKRSFREVKTHLQNGRQFSNFCEAQTVRNSGMAINMTRYLEKQPGRNMVVLTGIWHAVKFAIPTQLQRLGKKLSYTVILPETPFLNAASSGLEEADYLVEL